MLSSYGTLNQKEMKKKVFIYSILTIASLGLNLSFIGTAEANWVRLFKLVPCVRIDSQGNVTQLGNSCEFGFDVECLSNPCTIEPGFGG